MKRALAVGVLTVASIGFTALSASAAPLPRPSAPAEAATTAEQVQHRYYYRDGRRYYRHRHYVPRAYYGPRYYGYAPYYRDYYYGAPGVTIGLPFVGVHVGPRPRRHYYGYW